MSALGQKQTFKLLFDVIDWMPVREPKLRIRCDTVSDAPPCSRL